MENVLDILGIVCPILARILIPLAVNFDCRARNLAQRRLFTILCVFFPVIMGIIYAIRRKSLQKAFKVCSKCGSKADPYATNCPKCGGYMLLEYKNPKAKMLKTISIVLCVVGVLSYCVGEFVGMPSYIDEFKDKLYGITEKDIEDSEDDEEGYYVSEGGLWYDRNGIAYSDYANVKFFDKNGKEYHWELGDDEYEIVGIIDEDGKKYEFGKSFIDEDGYFCYGDYECDENGLITNSEGKTCYYTTDVSWDYTGQLHYLYDE